MINWIRNRIKEKNFNDKDWGELFLMNELRGLHIAKLKIMCDITNTEKRIKEWKERNGRIK